MITTEKLTILRNFLHEDVETVKKLIIFLVSIADNTKLDPIKLAMLTALIGNPSTAQLLLDIINEVGPILTEAYKNKEKEA